MAKSIDINAYERSNQNMNPTHLGHAWERWHRGFELFATGKGVTDATQKRALLLYHAGLEFPDIFFTLTEEREDTDSTYQKCVKTLKKHFTPKINTPHERYLFRQLKQQASETVEKFITRLRSKSVHCSFTNDDEAIRDQVVMYIPSYS